MQPKLQLRLAASNIPHPDKASYGGEDAFFISDVGGGAAGVADGVGGWQESGINPAEYSAQFMEIAKRYIEGENLLEQLQGHIPPKPYEEFRSFDDADSDPNPDTDPSSSSVTSSGEWMSAHQAYDPVSSVVDSPATTTTTSIDDPITERSALGALAIAHRLTRKPGSATACVLRLDPGTGELDAANLGDSGFLVLRAGSVIFQSPHLQHFFDCPYQFGCAPDFTPATDTAEDAEVYRLALRPGDVIILATDGVLDNVWPQDMAALAPRTAEEVESACEALASLAACRGADPTYLSPYAVEAAEEGIDIPIWDKLSKMSFSGGKLELGRLEGGKLDDVTVVVGFVEDAEVGAAV